MGSALAAGAMAIEMASTATDIISFANERIEKPPQQATNSVNQTALQLWSSPYRRLIDLVQTVKTHNALALPEKLVATRRFQAANDLNDQLRLMPDY